MPRSDTLVSSWIEETIRELQRRNSELHDVEAKRASLDAPKRLYKAFSAFGNRTGGGIILLGVDETRGFAVTGVEDPGRLQHEVLNFVQTEMSYPLRLETTVADVNGRAVLAITVMEAPYTQKPVYYRKLGLDKGSYRRSSTSSVQMQPEEVRALIQAQVELREDFTARLVSTLPDEWYDPVEIERLRRILRASRPGAELDRLPSDQLLLKLQLTEVSGDREVPTIAGLLLLGKEQYLRLHATEHEIILVQHPTTSEEYDKRLDLKAPLLSIMETLESNFNAVNRIVAVHAGLYRYEIPRLHPKVCREAILNAIIHRSYTDYGSIFVRLYPETLEISNPGGFLSGIGPQNILTGGPRHRNRRLAEAFQIMGLVERAGMGVPKMFQYQLESGKAPPDFSANSAIVRVAIPTGQIDERMAAYVAGRYRAGFKFDVADLLVLNRLRSVPTVRSQEVSELTQRSVRAASDHLQQMVNKDLLRRTGTGSGTTYRYAPALQRELGVAARAEREHEIEQARHPEMVLQFVRRHGRITNRDCQILCDLTTFQASKLLRRLADESRLERRGESRKMTYYVIPVSS